MIDPKHDRSATADVEHLLHLLGMLPPWSDTKFWADLTEAESGDRGDSYFPGKIHGVRRLCIQFLKKTGEGKDTSLQYAAQYILMFFDRDDEKLFRLLDRVAAFEARPGRIGRRWAEDAVATAWRLYVPGRSWIVADDAGANVPPWFQDEE